MLTSERFYTLDDLRMLPDDNQRYELYRGELLVMNPPSHKHALLSAEILTALRVHVKAHDLGYVTGSDGGYLLHTDPKTGRQTVYMPDVAFISKARKAVSSDDIYVGAPDLAVEVISPSETFSMIRRKLQTYFAYGLRLLWLVYPDAKSIEVYASAKDEPTVVKSDGILLGGDLLPDFNLPVKEIFSVLD